MIRSEAWVLYRSEDGKHVAATLAREDIVFPDIVDDEVLIEPIYGCWEGNMTHALRREPIDIVRARNEQRIVIGNCGIARVVRCRPNPHVREGDICAVVSIGAADPVGYMKKAWGYDKIGSMGLLSKRCKVAASQLYRLPPSRFPLRQWASFWVRYPTAWSNWKVAYGAWRLQMTPKDAPVTHVWGWGGGVSVAELTLANHFGCKTVMLCSGEERAVMLRERGIIPLDRTEFSDLNFDEERYETDVAYRRTYTRAEAVFLRRVRDLTDGAGVSVFVENIGKPVYRATLRALARQGVIATSGWKHGPILSKNRATECIDRHTHVCTHAARFDEVVEAAEFAEKHGWIGPADSPVYAWEDVPRLASEYDEGRIADYFPLFSVNPEPHQAVAPEPLRLTA